MSVDDIPDQLQELFDRARAGLDAQERKSRKAVDSLNVEKTGAAKALAELQAQCKEVKADLDRSREYLHRASTLAALDREIAKARTELEQLKAETEKEAKALETLVTQRTEAEAQVVALENSAREATAERCRAQEMMEQLKAKVRSITLPA
jgi:chromosome segregation ATPase